MSPVEAVRGAEVRLAENGVPSPRVDAELLVAHVLGLTRTGIYENGRFITREEAEQLTALVARRAEREPLAYVLGEWGFRRLSLRVDRRVLVPRPETEVVVERSLELIADLEAPAVLDVGTGSGAIALSIADEHPGARVTAVDSSPDALAVARDNARRLGLERRVELAESDLLAGVSGSFDLVVSNPPYVSPSERSWLEPEVRDFEPSVAVVGYEVGNRIAAEALRVLRPGGWLVLECGDGQATDLAGSLRELGCDRVIVSPDLAGVDRVVEGRGP
ncbi:MAG TPA: peptide chain release factor N(5)-glutamine methyltransferase [Gaiellaceae bacterium]|nr:peptide chain release factor N(5)-glutamine methyltransferase [Gaiellaceae bacterium]